jgi:SpoVK/Ycf46/Vps4 family AAA+-type ATPase
MGDLAQPVTPRFRAEELVLPAKQQALFQDVYQAMKSLTEVHYGWGTARAWNECGVSVLFAGPPGTGKTMAAEVLAAKLKLPMYRIDLSQVVNKYIGETEKNLKRLFDAADISDTLLFFDEADALFGRRTEVKDAHDRYANLEISYLLERMERFKGLAILATNRKKDLDEAFLRRLRYIIDFPLPDVNERRRIWQQVIPDHVDGSQLNVDFLAKQFPLAGGHIRSIVFNACLQAAGNGKGVWGEGEIGRGGEAVPLDSWEGKGLHPLPMEPVVIAVKREYDKLNRSVSLQQFGPYTKLIEEMNRD